MTIPRSEKTIGHPPSFIHIFDRFKDMDRTDRSSSATTAIATAETTECNCLDDCPRDHDTD